MSNVSGAGGRKPRGTSPTTGAKATRATQRTQAASLKGAANLASQSVVTRTKGEKTTKQQQLSAAHPQLEHPTATSTADKTQIATIFKKLSLTNKLPVTAKKAVKKSNKTNEQIASEFATKLQAEIKSTTGKPLNSQKALAGVADIQNGNADSENANYAMMVLQMAMFTLGQQRLKTSGQKAELEKTLQDQKAIDSMKAAQKAQAKADKAKTSSIFSKIFKWAAVAVLVIVAAVAVVGAVFSGGAALPAVLLSIAAIVAVTKGVLDETGETAKMTTAFANDLQKAFPGMSDQTAQLIAGLTITIAFAIVQIACGFGGAGALTESISTAVKIFTLINTLGQTGADTATASYNLEAGLSMADKKNFDAAYQNIGFFQDQITKQMEELLKKMASLMKQAASQISSDTATTKSILGNIGGNQSV